MTVSERQALFDEKIQPLLNQLYDACHEHDFPMVAVSEVVRIEVKGSDDETNRSKVTGVSHMHERAGNIMKAVYLIVTGQIDAGLEYLAETNPHKIEAVTKGGTH